MEGLDTFTAIHHFDTALRNQNDGSPSKTVQEADDFVYRYNEAHHSLCRTCEVTRSLTGIKLFQVTATLLAGYLE